MNVVVKSISAEFDTESVQLSFGMTIELRVMYGVHRVGTADRLGDVGSGHFLDKMWSQMGTITGFESYETHTTQIHGVEHPG